MLIFIFVINVSNSNNFRKFKAALYAHVLALRNLDKSDIVCSCIAFIELLRIDSSNLQLHVTVAKYVQEQLNISIGNLAYVTDIGMGKYLK